MEPITFLLFAKISSELTASSLKSDNFYLLETAY